MLTRLYNCTMYRCAATRPNPMGLTPDRECNDRTRKNTESRELTRLPEGGEQRPLSLQPSFLLFFFLFCLLFFSLERYTLLRFKGKCIHAYIFLERQGERKRVAEFKTGAPFNAKLGSSLRPFTYTEQTISIPTVQRAHRGGSWPIKFPLSSR